MMHNDDKIEYVDADDNLITARAFSQMLYIALLKCISQNLFLKMNFSKCISQNLSLKMYFSKFISQKVFLKI